MDAAELMALLEASEQTEGLAGGRAVSSGYACDLLSWVMAHGRAGTAWITVQTHMNVVAVASLNEMACILLPEGIRMEAEPLQKAQEEGIPVLLSPLSAYEICGRMVQRGIPAPDR